MKYETWLEKYEPIKNKFEEVAFDGYMFKSYGEQKAFVKEHDMNHVWTLVEGERDSIHILPGLHAVNRMGFFITKNCRDDDSIIVIVQEGYPEISQEDWDILNTVKGLVGETAKKSIDKILRYTAATCPNVNK